MPAPAELRRELYFGDNLRILHKFIRDETIDLVYLDPPFNSQRDYNVIFRDASGRGEPESQIRAFEDTWHWGDEAEATLRDITTSSIHQGRIPERVALLVDALVRGVGRNDMTAYIVMMTPRLVEMHRVLKPTGSLYLHCDPTASHYLRLILDQIFEPQNFRNEIVWKRTSAHSSAKRYGPVHDVLLLYARSDEMQWVGGHQAYEEDYVRQRFARGGKRPWKDADLTGHGIRHGETGLIWRGFNPTAKGRHWAYPPSELDRLDKAGLIYWPEMKGRWPRLRKYLDETKGVPLQDVWTDIAPVNSQARERQHFPTQKPLALLERIISASSRKGDVILDPFCGCGTAIVAAEKLGRSWIGIDITSVAIRIIRDRLHKDLGEIPVRGVPEDMNDARELARYSVDGRYEFQWWALTLVEANPVVRRKGADAGIDGVFTFAERDGMKRVLVSVKSGHVNPDTVRALHGTVEREKASMGILVTLDDATPQMRREAAAFGSYESELWGKAFPKLQIYEISAYFDARRPALPPSAGLGFGRGERMGAEPEQQALGLGPMLVGPKKDKTRRARSEAAPLPGQQELLPDD